MPTILDVGSSLEAARVIADYLPENTAQAAQELYRVLVHVGVEVIRRKGHSPNTTEAVFHLPLELLAEAIGISRVTAWRHLPVLKELGVLDYKPHKASCRGLTRNSGCVWRVRLTPLRGSRARVSADDLRHRWRGQEMKGAASYAALKHTRQLQGRLVKIELLVQWAVSPKTYTNPVRKASVCFKAVKPSLEAVLDVLGVAKAQRNGAVDLAAQALAAALRDSSSLNWYRRLLWQLLRRFDAAGEDYSYQVYLAAQRAAVDEREDFARRAGALFQSRLKAASWFVEVMEGPPLRVGTKPARGA